jgi:hypothetical protein
MSNIEAKINSKLQEIESLFNGAPPNLAGVQAPVIIKNNSALIQGGLNIVQGSPEEENK